MQLLHLPLRAAAGSCIAFFFLDLLNILTLPYDNASIVSYLLSAHFLCSFLCSSLHLSGTRSLRFTYMRFSRCVPAAPCSCHAFASIFRLLPLFLQESLLMDWRPPALPHRLQCSTIGRPGLNRRVRHGNGCFPRPYRRQILPLSPRSRAIDNSTVKHPSPYFPLPLRKEVIQPHLPIRLPCYDFTPVIRPTLGSSLPCGLGH